MEDQPPERPTSSSSSRALSVLAVVLAVVATGTLIYTTAETRRLRDHVRQELDYEVALIQGQLDSLEIEALRVRHELAAVTDSVSNFQYASAEGYLDITTSRIQEIGHVGEP